jgi:streptomycin 6-kinase
MRSDSPVGNVGKSSAHVSAIVPKQLGAILTERAVALSLSRSRFTALVLEWWEAQGCPAVTPADDAMMILRRGKNGGKR